MVRLPRSGTHHERRLTCDLVGTNGGTSYFDKFRCLICNSVDLYYSYFMSDFRLQSLWLNGYSEDKLAGFQQNQGLSNNCGEFAAAVALNVLFQKKISGLEMASLADSGWLLKGLRVYPGGPTTPDQQARLIREYARLTDLPVEVTAKKGTSMQLCNWLAHPDITCLVTIAWDNRRQPKIKRPEDVINRVAKSPFFWSGHTMLLAACLPPEPGNAAGQAQWGFINSWTDAGSGSHIFWMDNDDFQRCWNYYLFPIGTRNVVTVRRIK